MAYQSIGRGTSANDGTGDDLRTGAGKINANFVEVYTYLGDGSTISSDAVVTETATQTLTNKTVTGTFTGNITGDVTGDVTGNVTGDLTGDVTGGVTGNVTGDLTGDVTGNVTGNVTGDVTGDVTGNLTGNVTGNVTGDLTGDVTGNVTGDLTGDVTGNVSTASGNLQLDPATQIVEVLGNGSDTEGRIVLNCETNAHGQTIIPQPHSEGVTNTLTLPAGSDQELVGTIDTQTLTNKTLTAPTITGAGVASFATVDAQFILSADSQTGDGSTTIVVDPDVGLTLLTSSASGDSATLADSSVVGTTINIILESDGGGDVTLTPTTFLNGSTITFADAGDQVTLVWTGTNGWAMIGAGFGAPAIA